jgi:hypothetical protein
MEPLTIFITVIIIITLLSLFYILTARSNDGSGGSKHQFPERRF